jgi:hypothetical protein
MAIIAPYTWPAPQCARRGPWRRSCRDGQDAGSTPTRWRRRYAPSSMKDGCCARDTPTWLWHPHKKRIRAVLGDSDRNVCDALQSRWYSPVLSLARLPGGDRTSLRR